MHYEKFVDYTYKQRLRGAAWRDAITRFSFSDQLEPPARAVWLQFSLERLDLHTNAHGVNIRRLRLMVQIVH